MLTSLRHFASETPALAPAAHAVDPALAASPTAAMNPHGLATPRKRRFVDDNADQAESDGGFAAMDERPDASAAVGTSSKRPRFLREPPFLADPASPFHKLRLSET